MWCPVCEDVGSSCYWMTLYTSVCVKRLIGWCMPCVWLLTFSVPLHDVCGVFPNSWAGQHWCIWRQLERALPTRYWKFTSPLPVLSPSRLLFFLLFALILLLDQLIDVVFSFYLFMCLFSYSECISFLKRSRTNAVNKCAVRVSVKKFVFWVIS